MDIDAGPRYELLKEALKKGYSKSKNQHHEIYINQNDRDEIESILFKYDGENITDYAADTGMINDNGAYSKYYSHLDHNKVLNVLRNTAALEMAIKDKLIKSAAPIRAYETQAGIQSGWTVVTTPTKIKFKAARDGKPILSVPVRRHTAADANITTDTWIIYAIKPVPTPKNPSRFGGYGRDYTDPGR